MKRKLRVIALILLLCLAGFVRLFHIDQYMQFQGDEGRDSIVLWKLAVEKKLTLIGPGTSIGNMYNGPLYYYLVLPAFIASGLSPVGPSVFVALLGVISVWFTYKVGKEWFSNLAGSTAAVLFALSPTAIIYSRSSWNPNVMPFFALLCIYSIWKVYKSHNYLWLYVAGVSLAFAIQSHYLALLLAPTMIFWTGIYYVLHHRGKLVAFRRHLLYSGLTFLLLMSPILIFDFRHNFLNLKAMWIFFTHRQTTVNFKVYKAFPELLPLFTQLITRLVAATVENFGRVTTLVFGLSTILLSNRKRHNPAFWLLLTWLGFGILGLGLYKQTIYDHYFGFLYPAIFLLTGVIFDYFWNKKMIYQLPVGASFIGLLWVNVLHNPQWSSPNYLYQHTQAVGNLIIQESHGQEFNLGMISEHNYDPGYRFVLIRAGAPLKEAPQTITDQLFVICEDKVKQCNPVGHPKAEIANFGWAKIDRVWHFTWGATLFRLVHNQ